jgi:hypothetical protein
LAVAQVLLGCNSERRWLRFVGHRLRHLFPYVPGQSGYNRRLRAAAPALRLTLEHLARTAPSWGDQWRLLDATPVPCGASRETVKRSDLAGWAGYGYDRSHPRWYWGPQAAPAGGPGRHAGGLGSCHPQAGRARGRGRAAGVGRDQGLLRPGMVIAADKGLAGHRFAQGVGQLGAVLVRPDRRDEPHRWGSLGGIRQWIEGIIDTLKDQLGLERHGAHTPQGLWVRVAQRLLALAAGIWFNWQLGVADKRSLVAYDH